MHAQAQNNFLKLCRGYVITSMPHKEIIIHFCKMNDCQVARGVHIAYHASTSGCLLPTTDVQFRPLVEPSLWIGIFTCAGERGAQAVRLRPHAGAVQADEGGGAPVPAAG